jgi:hypothetical protein
MIHTTSQYPAYNWKKYVFFCARGRDDKPQSVQILCRSYAIPVRPNTFFLCILSVRFALYRLQEATISDQPAAALCCVHAPHNCPLAAESVVHGASPKTRLQGSSHAYTPCGTGN